MRTVETNVGQVAQRSKIVDARDANTIIVIVRIVVIVVVRRSCCLVVIGAFDAECKLWNTDTAASTTSITSTVVITKGKVALALVFKPSHEAADKTTLFVDIVVVMIAWERFGILKLLIFLSVLVLVVAVIVIVVIVIMIDVIIVVILIMSSSSPRPSYSSYSYSAFASFSSVFSKELPSPRPRP